MLNGYLLLRTKVPVTNKKVLKIKYARTTDLYMSIPPEKFFTVGSVNIPVADVDTAHKTGASVYNNNLPVIPVIRAIGKSNKQNLVERKYFHTTLFQFADKF